MKRFIFFLFTLVIIDPYKGLKYDQINAYYFVQVEEEKLDSVKEELSDDELDLDSEDEDDEDSYDYKITDLDYKIPSILNY